ncbi:hypothetical protein [Natronorubrum sp. FCH18a]
MTLPPAEPMLAFAAGASVLYLAFWWVWWNVLVDNGVELEYSEDGSELD